LNQDTQQAIIPSEPRQVPSAVEESTAPEETKTELLMTPANKQ